jgi:hypothetical protein
MLIVCMHTLWTSVNVIIRKILVTSLLFIARTKVVTSWTSVNVIIRKTLVTSLLFIATTKVSLIELHLLHQFAVIYGYDFLCRGTKAKKKKIGGGGRGGGAGPEFKEKKLQLNFLLLGICVGGGRGETMALTSPPKSVSTYN